MIRKKARRLLFLEAGMFILIVYLLITGITYFLDTMRIKELETQIANYGVKHESFLASNYFYEALGEKDCGFSKKYIFNEYGDIKELSMDITNFKERILSVNEKKHDLKRKEFLLVQIENFNKVKKHNALCENKIFPLLFFVDGDIIGFNRQALLVEQFAKNHDEEVIVYVFDINFKEELIVDSLIGLYNISSHNTVIFGELSNAKGGVVNIALLGEELENLRGV